MKKLMLLILPVIGFLGGAAAGDLLQSGKPKQAEDTGSAEPAGSETTEAASKETAAAPQEDAAETATADDWFKFPNQFFVPILRNGSTTAIMVLSLTIEMPTSARPKIEAQENRLRDALLNALMILANTGGFDGNFTAEVSQERLRTALLDAARKAAGPEVSRVLIEDIARQDQ